MKFTVYGENVTINDKMQEKIEQRLSDLNKYVVVDESISAKVAVKIYGTSLKVEVSVPSKVGLLVVGVGRIPLGETEGALIQHAHSTQEVLGQFQTALELLLQLVRAQNKVTLGDGELTHTD